MASIEKLIALEPKVLCYSHFGEASNAAERLRKHAMQLGLWMSIAKDSVMKKESLSTVCRRVLAEDKSMAAIAGFFKSNPIYYKLTEESVQGFVESASKATA